MKNILEIKNLSVESKENKKKILEDISLNIEERSIFALVGPNGSGKSTLASTLMGLPKLKIIAGKIIFDKKDITALSVDKRARMGITLSFQEPAYFEGITVENFLKVGNKNINTQEIKKMLSLIGLKPEKMLSRFIDHNLSGGERKRIEFASVALMNPKLMILDEPDSGLDTIIYREIYDILENIRGETNCSILLITHREEIASLANKAAFLHQGKIICQGGFNKVMSEYCKTIGRRERCRRFKK